MHCSVEYLIGEADGVFVSQLVQRSNIETGDGQNQDTKKSQRPRQTAAGAADRVTQREVLRNGAGRCSGPTIKTEMCWLGWRPLLTGGKCSWPLQAHQHGMVGAVCWATLSTRLGSTRLCMRDCRQGTSYFVEKEDASNALLVESVEKDRERPSQKLPASGLRGLRDREVGEQRSSGAPDAESLLLIGGLVRHVRRRPRPNEAVSPSKMLSKYVLACTLLSDQRRHQATGQAVRDAICFELVHHPFH